MRTLIILIALLALCILGDELLPNECGYTLWATQEVTKDTDAKQPPAGTKKLATAFWNESTMQVGWDQLIVQPDPGLLLTNASGSYYHAGYLEGYVTANRMAQVIPTQLPDLSGKPEVEQMLKDHIRYIKTQAGVEESPFWTQVANLLELLRGITDGYAANMPLHGDTFLFEDIFLYNFQNEIGAFANKIKDKVPPPREHCSAFVKVTDEDLFISQDNWYFYSAMVRTYKTYVFETTVSMTGYVALISSTDDWYVTSNKLAVQETSTGFFNTTLYDYVSFQSVSEFIRVMVANFLAKDGQTWSQLFAQENSGTYNNQYMVVDAKLYTPKQPLPDGLLWIAEQIPGRVESKDMTETLRNTSYWASYNIPYFPFIYQESGFAGKEQTEGLFWSYDQCPRAKMFRAGESAVKDLNGMKQLMRQNNYKTDPNAIIPNCTTCDPPYSPLLAIASRGDLVQPGWKVPLPPLDFYNRSAFGSIDCKIAAWSDLHLGNLVGYVISGPTTENGLPPFQFSGSQWADQRPEGSPDVFNFPWVQYNYSMPPPPPTTRSMGAAEKIVAIIFGIGGGLVILVGMILIPRQRPGRQKSNILEGEEQPLNPSEPNILVTQATEAYGATN